MTLWVFGYGSLIWHPEFDPAERVLATAEGWHRSFCMRSIHHRGTPDQPGLVLALDRAERAQCAGLAFAVQTGEEERVLGALRERELVTAAYLEAEIPLVLRDGRSVQAVTFVIDRQHDQYCANLALDEQARIIAAAEGGRGPNAEYLFNTVAHLAELGIQDRELAELAERVRRLL